MRKWAWLLAAVGAVAGAIAYGVHRRGAPPVVNFTRVVREKLVSTLSTNGKLEPVEYSSVRSTVEGPLKRLVAEKGKRVHAGDVLAEVDLPGAQAELASGRARLAQALTDLARFDRGGDATARVEVENGIAKARLDLDTAEKDAAREDRLVSRQAATRQEAAAAHQRVSQLRLEIESLEKRRNALITPADREAAAARRTEAESAVALAARRIEEGVIRSPIDGIVYNVPLRMGAFVHPGDTIADVGKLDRLRVAVYVDEPELGRVAIRQPVTVTWDGEPDRRWQGEVERMPTEIVALGTRQVGEVTCLIPNPDLRLPPGANIIAEIRTNEIAGALTIPKEALRRKDAADGVFLLRGDTVAWRAVKLGTSSVTRVAVLEGLKEGDAVALPTENPLLDGQPVEPAMQ